MFLDKCFFNLLNGIFDPLDIHTKNFGKVGYADV